MSSPNAVTAARAPRRSSLTQNVAALYALQIANYMIPLLTLPYLIRVLGAAQYGLMTIAYAEIFFMVLFVDAGFNTLATRRLARPGIGARRISEIYAATQLIKVVQCAAMFLLLFGLTLAVPNIGAAAPIYYATFPIVLGSLLFPTWLFQGLEIMHLTTLCNVGGRLLATAGIFVLVKDPGDVAIAALLQASATAISGLLAMPFLFGRLRLNLFIPRYRLWPELRRTFAEARALAPAEFITDAFSNSGIFILGLFASDAAVGVYAAIEKIARAGASLFQPLIKALFPVLSGHWMSATPDATEHCRIWTQRILLLAAIAAIAMFAVAPFGLELLFGAGWSEYAALLRVLAAWLAANVAAAVLGQFWLLARGERSTYARCLVFAGVFQLIATILGAWSFGALGLVAATVIAEFVRIVLFYLAAGNAAQGTAACAS
ncbi:MAG: oligosaccharide flippase family protein [Gammaproteobacteria bacterium]|nr:oligosaccharide flippase family protein [Gammaproteobacteria bacterium]